MAAIQRPVGRRLTPDEAWDQYASLQRMVIDEPQLSVDRHHCHSTLSAWRRFSDLYLDSEQTGA
jgi:ABC-type hemin transport system ATPase subunit